jgi:ABC-type sugar transport system ATPase subunit
MIRLEQVSKHFENTIALRDINLTIEQGEFVALLGPSGCGKSTTLMILAGLLRPTTGNVYFNERLVNDVEPKDRNIGMVFQSYALYPHLSVRDNIAFLLKQRGIARNQRYAKAAEIAKIVRIEELLTRQPHQLSGGQQQRVAMARALAKDPDILLLDEPMSNLDARLKVDVRDEIRRLQQQLGVTTIIVTHDQEEAMAISDKIAILDKGQIQQYDTPENLFNQPANLFVAHFMGTPPMNFLYGTLEQHQDGQRVRSADFLYNLPAEEPVATHHLGKQLALGIRPHHIHLDHQPQPNTIAVVVDLVEQLGRERLVKAHLPNQNGADVNYVRILAPPTCHAQRGDTLYLSLTPAHLHLFDVADNGRNLLI